jgi:hypothetical protein
MASLPNDPASMPSPTSTQEVQASTTQPAAAAPVARKPGRPPKYASVEEKRAAERLRKQQKRASQKASNTAPSRSQATTPADASGDDDEDEERMARYAKDYGHVQPPDPSAINAVQVIINYLKQPGNYATWRKASPSAKNKVIRILQEEMAERGMQSASRDSKAILGQVRYSLLF